MATDEHRFWPTNWDHPPDDRATLPKLFTICGYLWLNCFFEGQAKPTDWGVIAPELLRAASPLRAHGVNQGRFLPFTREAVGGVRGRNWPPAPSEGVSQLLLLHRMEERAGERRGVATILSRLPSPQPSPRSCVAGREGFTCRGVGAKLRPGRAGASQFLAAHAKHWEALSDSPNGTASYQPRAERLRQDGFACRGKGAWGK